MARATKKAAAGDGDAAPGRANVRRGLVEQEIYDHATRLFAERGFAGTSFQDIADAVGLTRPALYHYVRSKDELLAKLVSEIVEDAAAEIAEMARRDDLDAAGKLRTIVAANVRRQGEQAARFQLLIRSEADLPPEVSKAHDSGRRAVLRSMASLIDEGIDAGLFRPVDARVAALGVIGIMNWVAWWYTPGTRNDIEVIADQLADQAIAGLLDSDGADGAGAAATIAALRSNLDRLERLI